jgi:acetyl esterase/lipase
MPTLDELVKMRVVLKVPGTADVRVRRDLAYRTVGGEALAMDVYAPPDLAPGAKYPTVVLIHGGPIPPQAKPKGMGVFVSLGETLAASGFVAVTFNHRFYGEERLRDASEDVAVLVERVRRDAPDLHADPDRIGLWSFSGGGPFLSAALRDAPPYVRALVAYYAVLDLQVPPPGVTSSLGDEARRELSPLHQLAHGSRPTPPIFVARAGQDSPWLNATIDRFVDEALRRNASLTLITHAEGRHGFDILDDVERSREILRATLEFLKTNLR